MKFILSFSLIAFIVICSISSFTVIPDRNSESLKGAVRIKIVEKGEDEERTYYNREGYIDSIVKTANYGSSEVYSRNSVMEILSLSNYKEKRLEDTKVYHFDNEKNTITYNCKSSVEHGKLTVDQSGRSIQYIVETEKIISEVNYYYDQKGNLIKTVSSLTEKESSSLKNYQTDYTYNDMGYMKSAIVMRKGSEDGDYIVMETTYDGYVLDDRGNWISRSLSGGRITVTAKRRFVYYN